MPCGKFGLGLKAPSWTNGFTYNQSLYARHIASPPIHASPLRSYISCLDLIGWPSRPRVQCPWSILVVARSCRPLPLGPWWSSLILGVHKLSRVSSRIQTHPNFLVVIVQGLSAACLSRRPRILRLDLWASWQALKNYGITSPSPYRKLNITIININKPGDSKKTEYY